MTAQTRPGKAMDAALDHISMQGRQIQDAKLALLDIRSIVSPFVPLDGPAGALARSVDSLAKKGLRAPELSESEQATVDRFGIFDGEAD